MECCRLTEGDRAEGPEGAQGPKSTETAEGPRVFKGREATDGAPPASRVSDA
jgi:hypothetical protein